MARRVNSKFLLILTILVVGLGMGLFLAKRFLIRESPEKYVAAGSAAMAEKNYRKAVENFRRAVSLDNKNPSLWVAYGDACSELSPEDVDFMTTARKAWFSALTVQPDYKPALDRQMQFLSDAANINSRDPDIFKPLHETAVRLFAADPNNIAAEIAVHTSIIRPWLAGIEQDEKVITDTIEKLEALMKRYPDNADLPMFTAQAKLHLSEKRHQQEDPEKERKLVAQADAIVENSIKQSVDGNKAGKVPDAVLAAMYFSAAQVTNMQRDIHQRQERTDIKGIEALQRKERDFYARAREKAKPIDPLYVYIHIFSARASADKPEAEKILKALLKEKPDDQQVRLELAGQLASVLDKRDEALEVLDRPFANESMKGPRAYLVRELQVQTLATATNLRIEQLARTSDETARKKTLARIQDSLNLVATRDGEGPRVLRLRGKLLRVQGKTVEAIQTLERARMLADQRRNPMEVTDDRLERWEVMDMLARAYIETRQIASAKALLTDLINRFPNYDPARMLLASVLIQEGKFEDAKTHVNILKERKPGDPEVLKLEIQVAQPKELANSATKGRDVETERKQLKAVFGKLPEESKQQILEKIGVALYISQPDDAVRLLNKAATAFPGDYDVARSAVGVYRERGEIENAKAFVDKFVQLAPNEPKLKVLKEQVADLTPENLARIMIKTYEQNPDKLLSHIGQAQGYRRLNMPKETLEHLLAAKKLKPDDNDVNSLLFSYYLWQKQWDQAEALISPLARANQDQAGGLLFRYQLAMERQDYPTALTYAQSLVQRMGEFSLSWLSLGRAFHALGNYDEALKNYLAALERQSDNADAFQGCIDCYYAMNRINDARSKITAARRALPFNPNFQEQETRHELLYGEPANAIPPREEQARKNPDKPQAVMALGQAYLATGRARAAKRDPQERAKADDYYKKAKETFNRGITKWPDYIEFYAFYAETSARSGELGDSEQKLKQLTQREAWKGKPEAQMLLAEFYAISRRAPEAEAALRGVVAQQPTNIEAELKLANLLINLKRLDDALKVLDANRTDPQVAKRRVDALIAAGRAEEAEKALDEILARTPSSLEILQMAAGVNIARGNFDLAEKRLNRALEINRKDPTTHYYVGLLRVAQPKADLEAAIKEFEMGRFSPLVGVESRFARADCLRRMNSPDAAIKELEDGLKQQPGNKRIRLALLDSYAGVQPARWIDHDRTIREAKDLPGYEPDPDYLARDAAALTARNMFKEAVDAINKALELSPNDMSLTRTALTLLNKSRKFPDVVSRADALVAKDPTLWWAFQARAVAKRNQDKKEDSIKDFESALTAAAQLKDDDAAQEIIKVMADTIGPDQVIERVRAKSDKDDRWKLVLSRLQQQAGDTAGAVKTFEQVLAREDGLPPSDREQMYRFGGTLYLISNQPVKSKKCYDKLLEMAPDDMTALNNMACLMGEVMQPPQPQEGIKYSQRAFDLMQRGNRRDPLVLDTHGWLLTLCGQLDEGIEVLRKANELRQIPDAHYHLGMAYLQKQMPEPAQRELDTAMDLLKTLIMQRAPVDPTLQTKIENAIGRAGIMMRQKRTSANANTPNAP